MSVKRQCQGRNARGEPCGSAPLVEGAYCFMHDPDRVTEVAEARRLGGFRRRKESVVSMTFRFQGLDSVPKIRRLVEVAVMDTLAMENSIARARTLGYLAQQAVRLLEVGELEDRVAALEAVATDARPL